MNVVVPGSGLILAGRPWTGFALAVWFSFALEVALCGFLIAPASLPRELSLIAAGLAAIAWLVAQRVMYLRIGEWRRATETESAPSPAGNADAPFSAPSATMNRSESSS